MEALAEHEKEKKYKLLYTINTLIGGGIVVLVLIWIMLYTDGFGLSQPNFEFFWHPFLMCFSMLFLYSQSILAYRTGRNFQKKTLKTTHAILNFIILVLAIAGVKAVFDSHNDAQPPKPNLYSMHSWIGLLTVILFVLQFLIGFISFLWPGASKALRSALLPFHVVAGTAGFFMACVTALMGLTEQALWNITGYNQHVFEGNLFNFIGLLIVIFGFMTIHMVTNENYQRAPLPEDQATLLE